MERLKQLLIEEVGYVPADNAIEIFLSMAEEVRLNAGDVLIEAGKYNADVYIVKEGIIRYADMNGDKERTFAFGLAGTLFMSMHSFVMHEPSYYQIEACCETVVLRIPEKRYWEAVRGNIEIAIWMLHVSQGELCFLEHINSTVHNGDARERYIQLKKRRPEILSRVPQRIIASYLGVTPEYLSRLKRTIK